MAIKEVFWLAEWRRRCEENVTQKLYRDRKNKNNKPSKDTSSSQEFSTSDELASQLAETELGKGAYFF